MGQTGDAADQRCAAVAEGYRSKSCGRRSDRGSAQRRSPRSAVVPCGKPIGDAALSGARSTCRPRTEYGYSPRCRGAIIGVSGVS
jgi:hypothetical protein